MPRSSALESRSRKVVAIFLNRPAPRPGAAPRQIFDNFVNQETRQHPPRFVTIYFHHP